MVWHLDEHTNPPGKDHIWMAGPVIKLTRFVHDEVMLRHLLIRVLITSEGTGKLMGLFRWAANESGKAEELGGAMDQLYSELSHHEALALEHRQTDYTMIHSHSLVALWAAVETCLEDTVFLLIRRSRLARSRAIESAPCRFKAADIDEPTESELHRFISNWERSLRQGQSVLEAWETMLMSVGVVADPDLVTDGAYALFSECNALRNCMLHRGGVIDQRARKEAPSIVLPVGGVIRIGQTAFNRYSGGIEGYLMSLQRRLLSLDPVIADEGMNLDE